MASTVYNEMGAKMPSEIARSWPFGWKWYYSSNMGFHRFHLIRFGLTWLTRSWCRWNIAGIFVYLTNIDVSVQYIPEIRLMVNNKTSRFSKLKHDFCAGKLTQSIFWLKSFRENRKSLLEILSFWLVLSLQTWRRSRENAGWKRLLV